METSHLCITAPVRPPISLQAPNTRKGVARFPAPHHAYHDKQLFRFTKAAPHPQSRGWEPTFIAALEHRDRVWWIHLQDLPSALLEKLATMMQESFPKLNYLRLWADDETSCQAAPVLPEGFLGGSATCLETLWLKGIPFPELPKLLLSTNDLVQCVLEKIPDSGYISPEAMTAALSTCTKLENARHRVPVR